MTTWGSVLRYEQDENELNQEEKKTLADRLRNRGPWYFVLLAESLGNSTTISQAIRIADEADEMQKANK